MKYLVVLALLASCAIDPDGPHEGDVAGDANDARPPDTVCGVPIPGIVPPSIRIEGKIETITSSGTQSPDGIRVNLRRNDGQPEPTTLTEAGAFSFTVVTHGAPIDGYLEVEQGGSTRLLSYPGVPYTWDTSPKNALPMIEPALLGTLIGVPAIPNTGTVIVATHDCERDSVLVGATVTSSAGTSIRYMATETMNAEAKLTPDSTTTAAVISGVPVGEVIVSASTATRKMRTARVGVSPNGLTIVDLYPQ